MLISIISSRCCDRFGDSLHNHFTKVFALPPDEKISPEIADHPDMILSFIGDSIIVPDEYYRKHLDLIDEIADSSSKHIVASTQKRIAKYPYDIGMNALVTDRHIFGKTSAIAPEVLAEAAAKSLRMINVKQGYAGCSSIAFGNTIVSGDKTILNAAQQNGYDTVEIDNTGITLSGYDHGFIGGASGALKNTVYFLGDPDNTQGCESLTSELSRRCISSIILSSEALADYGGIKIINA